MPLKRSQVNPSSNSLPNSPARQRRWLNRSISRLGIGSKIGIGYAIALSVAVLGTTAGFLVGNSFYEAAFEQEDAIEEIHLLTKLQTHFLQAQTHQQRLLMLPENSELWQTEYSRFLEHTAEFTERWQQYVASEGTTRDAEVAEHPEELVAIENLLQTYREQPEAYLRQTERLLQQMSSGVPSLAEAAKAQLSNIISQYLQHNDNFTDDLDALIQLTYIEYEQAEAGIAAAEAMRRQIIAGSMALSIAVAALLAIFTSRAIARPLVAVTQVARQVTQNSNFDLQAPVVTGDEIGVLATSINQLIDRVKHLLKEQQAEASRQLLQSEKMSSLGRMIAGVAHEINNPVNFIYGNVGCAATYVEDLLQLLSTYEATIAHSPAPVQQKAAAIDLEFLREDLPKLLQSMEVGADRIRQIVLSLKNFSRLDEASIHRVDLHECIDSTLLILNNRLKKNITIVRNYGSIPNIEGYPGTLYQVFMNLLSNAIEALEGTSSSDLWQIVITTEPVGVDRVAVRIADNGAGIAIEHQARIFETFFTTKPVGVGTGLGLSISREIVVDKHGGSLTFTSKPGRGTEFVVTLPIKHSSSPKPTSPPLTLSAN
jgi:signal transduction histidine kinase